MVVEEKALLSLFHPRSLFFARQKLYSLPNGFSIRRCPRSPFSSPSCLYPSTPITVSQREKNGRMGLEGVFFLAPTNLFFSREKE